jgi:hypothetical protein
MAIETMLAMSKQYISEIFWKKRQYRMLPRGPPRIFQLCNAETTPHFA